MREIKLSEIEQVIGGSPARNAGRYVGDTIREGAGALRDWADGVVADYLRWRGIIE